jgi:GAF domain-containing protein
LHQIRGATEISRIISGVLDPADLMERVVELLEERFELYFVGIFLIDERSEMAILTAASGEAGRKMIAEGYKLAVGGGSMLGSTIDKRKPGLELNIGPDTAHFKFPFLPLSRSELTLPLITGDRLLGAISLQSENKAAFDDEDVIMFMGIADTLTTALENARLFQQVQLSLNEINTLNRQYLSEGWSKVLAWRGKIAFDYENRAPASLPPSGGKPADPSELSQLDVPLLLRQQKIGSLTLETDRATWSPEELAFIEAVTTQASLALENVRLLEDAQSRAQRDRLVADISRIARGTTDMDAILRNTILELGKALSASDGLIRLEMVDAALEIEA